MIRIVFLGFGKLGYNLCNALHDNKLISVNQIYNRSNIELPPGLNQLSFTTRISEIEDADVYVIAIPDDAIKSLSEKLPFEDKLVIHCSGGAGLNILSEKNRRGVLYPLQTFSKHSKVDFSEIPICLEAENASDLKVLKKIGHILSNKVVEINSEERAKLHLAAVFVNNFVNHMYAIGHDILSKNKLPFDLLKPLIKETAHKVEMFSPAEVQTGPAKRKDLKTIEKHLHLLKGSPYRELYAQITESISNIDGKKL